MAAARNDGPLDAYWLPELEDWPSQIAAIERLAPSPQAWEALVRLAGHRLSFLRAGRLDQALLRLFGDGPPPDIATQPIRLGLLSSSTTAHLEAGIRIAGLRRGLWITIHSPEYGQYRLALEDPGSTLHAFKPTALLLALDAHHLLGGAGAGLSTMEAGAEVDRVLADMEQIWSSARREFGGQIIQQTILPLFDPLMGSNEQQLPGSPLALASRLNERLRVAAESSAVDLLAIDHYAMRFGLTAWHDLGLWHRAKQEVSPRAAMMYGELAARLLAAAQGRSAKCLVLDLDNTLWGGVIGDDGLDGIVLGQGSAVGEAFAAFQSYALALAKRGVILAACSKNDEANALEAFERHPEMVLRRKDLSAFAANWNDKPSNIRAIAESLNIGLDSLVFVDDNPFERELVRRELPMVAVPEMPEDPALFASCLADAGYFESLAITEDDRARSGQYAANRERQAAQVGSTDLSGYLRSLEMTLVWQPFDSLGLKRVTQLINKTNQFNLTTRRYSEEEVSAIMSDPDAFGLQFRLLDRFGDNGIIAVVIGRTRGESVEIETWLMSCRVLGRRVEEATVAVVLQEAARRGATQLVGRYMPTAKNQMVADHYPLLGFTKVEGEQDGASFVRPVSAAAPQDLPIAIVAA